MGEYDGRYVSLAPRICGIRDRIRRARRDSRTLVVHRCVRQPQDLPRRRGNIVPMIKDRATGSTIRYSRDSDTAGARLRRRHSGSTTTTKNSWSCTPSIAKAFSYPPRSDFADRGTATRKTSATLALANLRARTPKREFSPVNGAWLLNADGNFEASLLLDDEIWNDPRFRERGHGPGRRSGARLPVREYDDTTPAASGISQPWLNHGVSHRSNIRYSRAAHDAEGRHFALLDSQEIDDDASNSAI